MFKGVIVLLFLAGTNGASLASDDQDGSGQATKAPTTLMTPPPPTTVAPTLVSTILTGDDVCTFEDDQCNWMELNSDISFKRGVTGERVEPPNTDHTLTLRTGHDMRVELKGTSETSTGLAKTFVSSSTDVCVDFWYNVAAYSLAARRIELAVEVASPTSSFTAAVNTIGTFVWSEARVPVTVKANEPFEVRLKVSTTGYVSYGGLSIDDVAIRSNCTIPPPTTTSVPTTSTTAYTTTLLDTTTTTTTTPEPTTVMITTDAITDVPSTASSTYVPTSSTVSETTPVITSTTSKPTTHTPEPTTVVPTTGAITTDMPATPSSTAVPTPTALVITTTSTSRPTMTTPKPKPFGPFSFNNPSCNFENGTCGWVDHSGDDFDWRMHSGRTLSEGTGPNGDHTSGNVNGHYMYIEATSPRITGDVASFISPYIQPSGSPACLEMWYHMYGRTTGRLEVDFFNQTVRIPVFEQSGNQGNQWHRIFIPLPMSIKNFQLEIRGIRGSSYTSDVAIDDLKLINNCKYTITTPTTIPTTTPTTVPTTTTTTEPTTTPISKFSFTKPDCDFESTDRPLCGWEHHGMNVFDWYRGRDGTPSAGTGPSVDHTLGNSFGHYMYIESSVPQTAGDYATLISPEINTPTDHLGVIMKNQAVCFDMWYHMHGADIGVLAVEYVTNKGRQKLFEMTGEQGNKWIKASIPLPIINDPFKLLISATIKDNYAGDIAVDDLKLNTNCTLVAGLKAFSFTKPVCDFEKTVRPLCGWEHHGMNDFDWYRSSGGTPSAGTGPSADHTLGNSFGHYMYIESSNPQTAGDYAALISPEINPPTDSLGAISKNQAVCLEMWYHMYGQDIGVLAVEYMTNNGSKKLFELTGEQGNKWINVSIPLPMINEPFKLLISATIKDAYQGDIAVDDLKLNTNCTLATTLRELSKTHTLDQIKQIQAKIILLQKELATLLGHREDLLKLVQNLNGIITDTKGLVITALNGNN